LANKQAKAPLIDDLADRLGRSSIAILTDYRGLSVANLMDLRRKLRAARVEYQVTKNTLTRFAAERVNKAAINQDLEGPTAIAFLDAEGDPVAVAKALRDAARETRVLAVRGGIMEGRAITQEEVESLATLPPAEMLRAQLVGAVGGPLTTVVGLFAAPLRDLVGVIDARIRQLQEQGEEGGES
jgi:large subunit ribosomal protein L10